MDRGRTSFGRNYIMKSNYQISISFSQTIELYTMAFKLVVLCAALAYANAGLVAQVAPVAHYSPASDVSSSYIHQAAAPVAVAHATPLTYSAPVATYTQAAPVAVHAPHIGSTSQSVVRSLGGNQAVSHYSKAVDSAFSSVRKYDTRITNDATYAHVAPVAAYASPIAHATYAHAAPVAHTYAAPVLAKTYAAAPVATYAHAAPVASYAAPVATYTHAAPVVSKTYAAAPVVAKAALAYSPATVVAHTTFTGLGAQYEW